MPWTRCCDSGSPAGPGSATYVLNYQADGWRYLQTDLADSVDRSGVNYDDSSWSVAPAPFGTNPGQPYDHNGVHDLPVTATGWPVNTALWARQTLTGVPDSDVTVQIRIDNYADIYWNGELIASGGVASWWTTITAPVPRRLLAATNVLAVRARDQTAVTPGDQTYFDAQVTGGAPIASTWDELVTGLPGVVHRWQFTEAAGAAACVDSVGGLSLALSGSCTLNPSGGLLGGTLSFGSNGQGQSAALGSIPVGAAPRCFIAVWRATQTTKGNLFAYGPTGTTRAWFAGMLQDSIGNAANMAIDVWSDDFAAPNRAAGDGDWHLSAFGYDGNRYEYLYHDGQLAAYLLGGILNTGSATPFYVGRDNFATKPAQCTGDLDELIVVDRWPGRDTLDRLQELLDQTR